MRKLIPILTKVPLRMFCSLEPIMWLKYSMFTVWAVWKSFHFTATLTAHPPCCWTRSRTLRRRLGSSGARRAPRRRLTDTAQRNSQGPGGLLARRRLTSQHGGRENVCVCGAAARHCCLNLRMWTSRWTVNKELRYEPALCLLSAMFAGLLFCCPATDWSPSLVSSLVD